MDALRWAINAAAILLVLYGARVFLQGRRQHEGAKAGLGCGYFFLACVLGSLASAPWLGGYRNALQLGAGIFLATPAIGALTRPHGSRLFLGVFGLILGILLAGPVVRGLWTDVRERQEAGPRVQLEETLGELRQARASLEDSLQDWGVQALQLRKAIEATGHESFDELSQDAEAMDRLGELNTVRGRIDWGENQLAIVDQKIGAIEQQLAALDERADSPLSDLEALGMRLPDAPAPEELTPVEEYARQKQLQDLFETEFD